MKLLFDYQIFSTQIYGGISRYFCELMKSFDNKTGLEYSLVIRYSNNHYLRQFGRPTSRPFLYRFSFPGQNKLLRFFNKQLSKSYISNAGYDIFHPTYYDPYFLDYIGSRPFVLTIYDMIHEIFNGSSGEHDTLVENKRLLSQKAAKIIAISESTKRDVVNLLGVPESKVTVIYLGNSLPNAPECSPNGIKLPNRYILFVGNRGRHKNFIFFIKSIRQLLDKDKDLNVICAGGAVFSKSEMKLFEDLHLSTRIHRYAVTDKVLAWLYKKALAFVFPSLYEGFGIPVLEAFSCGCSAALSKTSSLTEIGGDAAFYFDPTCEDSIAQAVGKVIYDEELRAELRARGLKQAGEFSWIKTARETQALYKTVV